MHGMSPHPLSREIVTKPEQLDKKLDNEIAALEKTWQQIRQRRYVLLCIIRRRPSNRLE